VEARSVGGVHWPELDGLRALAILLVLARHSLRPFISEDAYQAVATVGPFDLTPMLLNGWVGVDLFFVLSGFLIGRQALRGDGFARFWFRRLTRILPAYWACLAVVAVGLTGAAAWGGRTGDFLAHVVMLQDYTGSTFVAAFWSLGVEEKFYLLTPAVALLLGALTRSWLRACVLLALWMVPLALRAWAAGGVALPIAYEAYFPLFRSPFHLTFESLVVGFAIACLTLDGGRVLRALERRWVRECVFWSGAAGVTWWLVPGVILSPIDASIIVWAPALVGLGFGLMVLAAVSGPGSFSALLGGRPGRVLATGSYTLYLTHMMVLPVAAALAVGTSGTAAGITGQWLAFLPWYLGLSTASAALLHLLVEKPAIAWRNRVLRDWPRWSVQRPGRPDAAVDAAAAPH
jgi:peptidoglycan/LPS O-acetylase OafA/YrhL